MKSKILTTIFAVFVSAFVIYLSYSDLRINDAKGAYQVYLDGEKVGLISSEKDFYALINEDQTEIKNQYHVDSVYPPTGFDIVKYYTFDKDYSNAEDLYQKIKNQKPFTVQGYTFTIVSVDAENNKHTEEINVLDAKTFYEAAKQFVYVFVDETRFNQVLNDTQPEVTDVGRTIGRMYFEEKITYKESYISSSEKIYTDQEELIQYLLFGTNSEKDTYIIKEGDTIESVAFDHKLNSEEFLIANPRFHSKDSLLAIGEEVVIALINPVVTFSYEAQVIEDQETVFKKESRIDPTLAYGYKRITQQGQNGVIRNTKQIIVTNGAENQGGIITNTVPLREPINEITTYGRQYGGIAPSFDGNWGWPTNIPYTISSPYGYRWGGFHDAIDISGAGWGSPIYAAGDGVVTWSGLSGTLKSGFGYNVIISHDNNIYTRYAHLSSTVARVGASVKKGDIIGRMGNTGTVSPRPSPSNPTAGTHLHFSVYVGEPDKSGSYSNNPMRLWQ